MNLSVKDGRMAIHVEECVIETKAEAAKAAELLNLFAQSLPEKKPRARSKRTSSRPATTSRRTVKAKANGDTATEAAASA